MENQLPLQLSLHLSDMGIIQKDFTDTPVEDEIYEVDMSYKGVELDEYGEPPF